VFGSFISMECCFYLLLWMLEKDNSEILIDIVISKYVW
jgi:hypothetical protein